MTEGQYQALAQECFQRSFSGGSDIGWKHCIGRAGRAISDLTAELSARDAVIQQIRALAEAFRADSVGLQRGPNCATCLTTCADDIDKVVARILSALPSTEQGESDDDVH